MRERQTEIERVVQKVNEGGTTKVMDSRLVII